MSSGNGISAQISMQGTFQGREAKVFHILGQRSSWTGTTAFQDIAPYLTGNSFTELVGTESFELVSSDANDTAAGTGTRAVEMCYIDASYNLVCADYTLNGLTPVPVGVLGARMILWMEAADGGSSPVSAGNIDLRITGGGAVHERIVSGGNKSTSARFMVPDGFELLVPSWDTHSIRQPHDCRLRGTVKSFDRSLISRYLFQDTAFMGADQAEEHGLPFLKFPARSKIKVSAIPFSLAGTPRLDVSLSVILIKGD